MGKQNQGQTQELVLGGGAQLPLVPKNPHGTYRCIIDTEPGGVSPLIYASEQKKSVFHSSMMYLDSS